MNPPEECNFPLEDSIFISLAKRDYSITQQRVYNELFLHFIQSKTLNLHYQNMGIFSYKTSPCFCVIILTLILLIPLLLYHSLPTFSSLL